MVAGTFIQSTALLNGTYFQDAVIYITECNSKGAVGFIVNRLFPRKFNALEEYKHSIPFPLYEGGPVDTEHLFCIHRQPGIITGGALVAHNVYLGGDFKQAVRYINTSTTAPGNIKLFIGYCGWDDNELDEEIAEGSWITLPVSSDDIDKYLFKLPLA